MCFKNTLQGTGIFEQQHHSQQLTLEVSTPETEYTNGPSDSETFIMHLCCRHVGQLWQLETMLLQCQVLQDHAAQPHFAGEGRPLPPVPVTCNSKHEQ